MTSAHVAHLQPYIARARLPAPAVTGVITRVLGMLVEAVASDASVGDFYLIDANPKPVRAEVVALKGRTVVLLPYGQLAGMRVGASLSRLGGGTHMAVGASQLGRVIDALGHPLDGGPEPDHLTNRAIYGLPLALDAREPVRDRLTTGVRALDAFVPLGEGQRIGIFSGPGVGKSTLLGMLAQGAQADVIVLGLIGERGREVGHFVQDVLDDASRKKAVVVAATSDRPASERVRAAFTATTIAEHFRDQGKKVLLFIDSLSRLAMAQRDIGLATGEPPTSKGYPPSSFSLLPRLLERVASAKGRGSLTGVYTVLVEGDDMNEPVADAARGLLDGHVILSRGLATRGHFPAIDVLESLSRLESELTPPEELARARKVRGLLARIEESRELVSVGAYRAGADPQLDVALKLRAATDHFLQQGHKEHMSMRETQDALKQLADAAQVS